MKVSVTSVIFVVLLICNTAFAEKSHYVGIGVGGTEIFPDEGISLKNKTLNLHYEIPGSQLNYRLDLEHVSVDDDPKGTVSTLTRPSVNLSYKIIGDGIASGYLLGGLGYEKVSDARKGFDSHPFIQAGLGLEFRLNPKVSLTSEYKHIGILGGDAEEAAENVLLLGLRFATNPDISSYLKDADKDGVDDSIDQCPATPDIFSVSPDGCPTTVNLGVTFVTNSDQILNYYREKMMTFATFLKTSPQYNVILTGHTDSIGDAASNQKLSADRAIAVGRHLVSLGINPLRISTIGKGETEAVSSNDTDAGRALNRRVIASIHKGEYR